MLHNLTKSKSKKVDAMQALWKIKDEGKQWTREQSTEYEKLASEVKELQKEIDQRIEYQRYISNDQTSKDEKKFKKETSNIGILDLMKSLVARKSGNNMGVDAGKVNEFCREAENNYGCSQPIEGLSIPPQAFTHTNIERMQTYQRALTTAAASGGESIQDFIETPTLDVLYAKTVLAKVGAKVKELPAATGNYKVVKFVDSSTNRSSAKAEGAALDVRDVTIAEEFDLEPKRAGRIIVVSNLWMRQSKDPGVVERGMLKEFASKIDDFSLNGTGTNNQPTGILKDASLLKVAATTGANVGDAISLEKLVKSIEALELKNASAMGTSFIINPKVKRKASVTLKSMSANSDFLFERDRLLDMPTAVTTLMPSNIQKGTSTANLSNIFLTTPELICWPVWGLATISLSDTAETWFKADQTAFRIQSYFNVALERPDSSHCLIENLITEG